MVAPARPRLTLPPDLIAQLVELHNRGELDELLERVKVRLKLKRLQRSVATELSAMFAGPIRDILADAAALAVAEVTNGR